MGREKTKQIMMPLKKNVAIIWARVNTMGKIDGLKRQVCVCKEFAKQQDIEVKYTYTMISDGVSLNAERFANVVQYVTQHPEVNTLLVEGYDRMTRSWIELVMAKCFLQSRGVKLVSVTQPSGRDCITDSLVESVIQSYTHFENAFCTSSGSPKNDRL